MHDTVEFQLDALELLPVATEAEDGFQDEFALAFCEDSVLSHSIEANNILLIFGLDWWQDQLFPGPLFRYELRASCFSFCFKRILQRLVFCFLILLLCLRLVIRVQVIASFLETFDVEARLVDKWHGHERAKSRHIPEMHFVFADNLIYEDMLVLLDYFGVVWHTVNLWDLNQGILFREIWSKDVVSDALPWLQVCAHDLGTMVDV